MLTIFLVLILVIVLVAFGCALSWCLNGGFFAWFLCSGTILKAFGEVICLLVAGIASAISD
jgi:hypothetical protein